MLTAQVTLLNAARFLVFRQNDAVVYNAPPVSGTGTATYSVSGLPSGLYRYTATQDNPDGTYVTTSPVIYVRVQTSPTTITLASTPQSFNARPVGPLYRDGDGRERRDPFVHHADRQRRPARHAHA